jgi:hypothetical protein
MPAARSAWRTKAYGVEFGGAIVYTNGRAAGFTFMMPEEKQIKAVQEGRAVAIKGDANDSQMDAILSGRAVRWDAGPHHTTRLLVSIIAFASQDGPLVIHNKKSPQYLRSPTLNSDLYDHPALYDALLPVGAHLPYYMELARQASGDVLELACGTGQLTVPIASAGLPIVGLDLSPPMLNTARERAAAAKVSTCWATCATSIWAASLD